MIISTPEHSHSPILKMAVEAGKDAYVEKPMGNVLAEAKAARDATMKSKRIVQVGTQHRSEPYPRAAHELVQTGVLGRSEQGGNCLELPRPPVAWTRGDKAVAGSRIRIGENGCSPSPIVPLIPKSIANSACTRNSPAAFPING